MNRFRKKRTNDGNGARMERVEKRQDKMAKRQSDMEEDQEELSDEQKKLKRRVNRVEKEVDVYKQIVSNRSRVREKGKP
jgi:predicted  nucleic acid-binding Zn-ribbon protein